MTRTRIGGWSTSTNWDEQYRGELLIVKGASYGRTLAR